MANDYQNGIFVGAFSPSPGRFDIFRLGEAADKRHIGTFTAGKVADVQQAEADMRTIVDGFARAEASS